MAHSLKAQALDKNFAACASEIADRKAITIEEKIKIINKYILRAEEILRNVKHQNQVASNDLGDTIIFYALIPGDINTLETLHYIF